MPRNHTKDEISIASVTEWKEVGRPMSQDPPERGMVREYAAGADGRWYSRWIGLAYKERVGVDFG